MLTCIHCNRQYVSAKTLAKHQNTAIFCLRIQKRQDRIDDILRINADNSGLREGFTIEPLIKWYLIWNCALVRCGVRPAFFMHLDNALFTHRQKQYESVVNKAGETLPLVVTGVQCPFGLFFSLTPPVLDDNSRFILSNSKTFNELENGGALPDRCNRWVDFYVTRDRCDYNLYQQKAFVQTPMDHLDLLDQSERELARMREALPNEKCSYKIRVR